MIFAAIFYLATLTLCDAQSQSEKWLLPTNLKPLHYNLTLYTHIEDFDSTAADRFNFEGDVFIDLEVIDVGGVSQIVVHRDPTLLIMGARLFGSDDDSYVVGWPNNQYDVETNKQSFNVTPPMKYGVSYKLQLVFSGVNTDDTLGFYRSSYINPSGEKRWLVTTHFESAGARRAFPCFDEPKFKATYTVALVYSKILQSRGYHGLSNAEIDREFDVFETSHKVQFKTTPYPLSSYLVAFILSDFAGSATNITFNSSFSDEPALKPFRTWAQPDFIKEGRDAISQKFGPAILELYTSLFKLGFAYNKVDQAGIPDFRIGAMENWGMVTYQDVYLVPPVNSSISTYMYVARVICHELSHQWFGNLVTLHWWSDIWINEGFADYFEYFGTGQLRFPDVDIESWDLDLQFVAAELQAGAFVADSSPDSRPLTAEVWSPENVDANFDAIPYSKGGSILRMWQHMVGTSVFYKALQTYLQSRKFESGYPEALLSFFQSAVDEAAIDERPELPASVAEVFSDWHLLPGYPVLNVSTDVSNLVLIITQERFLSGSQRPTFTASPWYIPLTYSTDKELRFTNTTPSKYLKKGQDLTTITLEETDINWYIVNNQETGYYRVNYPIENWEALTEVLTNSSTYEIIHVINRAQIVDDGINLALVGHTRYLPISTALDILPYLQHETSLAPWRAASLAIRQLLSVFDGDDELEQGFNAFALELAQSGLRNMRLQKSASMSSSLLQEEMEELISYLASSSPRSDDGYTFFEDRSVGKMKRKAKSQKKDDDSRKIWLEANREEITLWLARQEKGHHKFQAI